MLNIISKSVFFTLFSLILINCLLLNAKEMYKWTDEDGTVHITDKKSDVPPEILENLEKLEWNKEDSEYYQNEEINQSTLQYKTPENYVDSIIDTEYERELKQQWRERAKEIEDRKIAIEYELRAAKEDYKYKKKELDYLLVEGYTVDARITELRNLESYIEQLEQEQREIAPLLDNLRIEARKAGIPEGYLRP